MKRGTVGHRGQVVIPDEIRRVLGIKPGTKVVFEVRNYEIVIKPDLEPEEFVEYYIKTYAKKLRNKVDLKKIIEEESSKRIGLS